MSTKNLIEKYFEGKTTLEEEAQLRAYFNQDEVDESLKPYQPLFQFFEKEKEPALGSGFDQKLMARLTSPAKVVPMRRWRHTALRIAAAGIVLVAAFLLLKPGPAPSNREAINWDKYEVKDEQLAYEETMKAFHLLSAKLNKGMKKTEREVAKTHKIGKYLN
ncbi:MAG: hypothetical protein ACE5FF_05460 [Saprospiraceae bacterium]